jgi:hypothetical protein
MFLPHTPPSHLQIGSNIALATIIFTICDRVSPFNSPYYLIHSIHNIVIVWLTASDVITTITRFVDLDLLCEDINWNALELVFALHFYHILVYWNKFRPDDWLHHILMIGVALPISMIVKAGPLLGYSLFFTTGLPGAIDYALLFLVRNRLIVRETEKCINYYLNTWIRSPGTATHAVLTAVFILNHMETFTLAWYLGLLTALLNYWNGQYFMGQVVYDAGRCDVFSTHKLA